MNSRKSDRYHQCADKKDSIYAAMDKDLKLKEGEIYKRNLRKEIAPLQIPTQCLDCKFRLNMCYMSLIRNFGLNFKCTQKTT